MDTDCIVTKDKEEFLFFEMPFFSHKSFKEFKELMGEYADSCTDCGACYWKECLKRCDCKDRK